MNIMINKVTQLSTAFTICLLWLSMGCKTEKTLISLEDSYPVIPTPQEITYGTKQLTFEFVSITANKFKKEGNLLVDFFNSKGIGTAKNGLTITLINKELPHVDNEEAYSLIIGDTIALTAATDKGIFYGIQTLKQLFRKQNRLGTFPEIKIVDWPAFKIRGFMHDTGRNFQSVAQLKEQIDVLAQYKMNVFHWHLTDDPGWRLESKKYPELQSDKATARGKGKFYTQEEFKEILEYCADRQITLIPEFDIPGHTAAFRRAFDLESMADPRVLPILMDLFDELISLGNEDTMPYIHMGTDEVRNKEEYVDNQMILTLMDHIKKQGREIIVWKEGIEIEEDSTSINQLWAQYSPREGHRFIDSRANYINHLDPFAGMARLFFQQPCRQPQGDELALGGILCTWPDNNVNQERDILRQNPIYPSILFYSDAIWKGKDKNYPEYWANLPKKNSPELQAFQAFEEKVLLHRDLFFNEKEFPYVKQTDIEWKIIGPFDHKGEVGKIFEVEKVLKESYTINDKMYTWNGPYVGATIHLKHFFGFPALTEEKSGTFYAHTKIYSPEAREQEFWIGFQGWSRSGGRRGGPTPNLGEWHYTHPKIWVNGSLVAPPIWQQPNLGVETPEIGFVDEDYFYRSPTVVPLKKGWNNLLLKIPHGGNSWKWMFSCVPINRTKGNVKEVKDLRFNASLDIAL